MIWVGGRIVAESSLTVSITDRTFEHGLGLFETFRTWDRDPVLLPRHLARMARSARALGLPLERTMLPDASAIEDLLKARQIEGDARLRLTLTGGQSASGGAVLWMRPAPLALPDEAAGAQLLGFREVSYDDPLARHKTLNYWRARIACQQAEALGFDDVLSATPDGLAWEGSRTNLFAVYGRTLATPPTSGPILPGIMREVVLERAHALGIDVEERPIPAERLAEADELFLTNAVRTIEPVARLARMRGQDVTGNAPQDVIEDLCRWPTPGPVTAQLASELLSWLQAGGR